LALLLGTLPITIYPAFPDINDDESIYVFILLLDAIIFDEAYLLMLFFF
jgi:hypothetical protein